MRNLIEFLQKHLYWLVFLALEVVSLILLFKYNSYQGSVYFTTANRAVGGAYATASDVVSYFHLGTENSYLEGENETLRREVIALKEQLRALGVVPDTLSNGWRDSVVTVQVNDSTTRQEIRRYPVFYNLVAAQVVSATLHRSNNLMTIDKGRRDGVEPEMGVITSKGVVGIVYLSSEHYAIVIPLLNTSSQISCRVKDSEYFGTMQWERGDASISYVSGIPRHAKVKKGDLIETNGYSDIFPEGIPVGKVVKVGDSPDGMTYRLTVRLNVDFTTLRNVSVVTNYSKPERKELEQQADSLMNPKKKA